MDQESAADILVRLREARPVLPVFVVTDTNDVADAVQAMRLGATAAVEVPPSTGLLREYVTQALK
jgi:DNA-binding NtrC family response regulator